jgi:hypothetical protein
MRHATHVDAHSHTSGYIHNGSTRDNGLLFMTNCSMGGEQTDRHNIHVNDLLLYSIKDI